MSNLLQKPFDFMAGMPAKDIEASLVERFVAPPFSILDARQGYWQGRKQQWIALGIKGEQGRDNLGSTVASGWVDRGMGEGGSIFAPVLCEVAYKWFCPQGGHILDPFASEALKGAGLYTVTVAPNGDLTANRWWTAAEIHKAWPDLFDATSGHLPMPVMRRVATEYFRALSKRLTEGHYLVPTGSGETIICLRMVFPGKKFTALYNVWQGTESCINAPLNALVKATGPAYDLAQYQRLQEVGNVDT